MGRWDSTFRLRRPYNEIALQGFRETGFARMQAEIDTGRQAPPRPLKILQRTAGWLATAAFVIALPVALVLGAVRFAFSWQPVYTYAIEAYHADEVTGYSTAQLLAATHTIRNYFTDNQRSLNITVYDAAGRPQPLFKSREIAHMRDVKALVQRVYFLLDLAVAYLAIYATVSLWILRRPLRRLAMDVVRGSLVTGAVIIAFAISSTFDFEQLFTEFHVISFSNDFWQLDPATDHLIQMFPQGFWLDVTLFVGLVALTGAILLGLSAAGYLWASRPTAESAHAA